MPLSIDQYAAEYLPGRGLPFPAAPKLEPVKAKPHASRLPIKAVMWTCYGTLLNVAGGELAFEAPVDFITDVALEKTVHEFKMWQSMSRKPGKPSEYMRELFNRALTQIKLTGSGGEKFPEVVAERVWEDILKKLQQKDYTYDVAVYGSPEMFLQKLAYFYHASIQGAGAYPGAAYALTHLAESGIKQGLLADGQSFTPAQLAKQLADQEPGFDLNALMPPTLRIVSANVKARKPSETIFKAAITALAGVGVAPSECLHVGSSVGRDLIPAKRHGFRTALYAGDKNSLAATPDQLREAQSRPDILFTDLAQVAEVVG